MKRWLILTVAAVLVLAWVAMAAQEGAPAGGRRARVAGGPGGGPGGFMMAGRGMFGNQLPLDQLGLSEEQTKNANQIRQTAMKEIEKIQNAMNEEIKKLLTPEQLTKLAEIEKARARRGPGGVTMTDEQMKIMEEARAEAAKVDDPAARGQIMRDAMEKIRATYTEEQKKQAAEGRGPGGRRGGGGGGGGGGAGG